MIQKKLQSVQSLQFFLECMGQNSNHLYIKELRRNIHFFAKYPVSDLTNVPADPGIKVNRISELEKQ